MGAKLLGSFSGDGKILIPFCSGVAGRLQPRRMEGRYRTLPDVRRLGNSDRDGPASHGRSQCIPSRAATPLVSTNQYRS